MNEPLNPVVRFENFLDLFREEFNAKCDVIKQAEDKTKFHRNCINNTIVKAVALTNPILRMVFNDLVSILDAMRMLQYLAISHPDVLDDARDELVSIIKELSPDTDVSFLEE